MNLTIEQVIDVLAEMIACMGFIAVIGIMMSQTGLLDVLKGLI